MSNLTLFLKLSIILIVLFENTTAYKRRLLCGSTKNYPKVLENEIPKNSSVVVTSNLLPGPGVCATYKGPGIVAGGGEKTKLDEFPWMALLDYKDEFDTRDFRCGGALINTRYVLTAAHCVVLEEGSKWKLVSVRLGEYDLATKIDCDGKVCAPRPLDIPIEEEIVCKDYNPDDEISYHDIALLRLQQKVQYSRFIQPICLPNRFDESYESRYGPMKSTIVGWGTTETGMKSNIKLKVPVSVQNCLRHYNDRKFHIGQICAGGAKGKDSCKGDSGGPLIALKQRDNRMRWHVIGVVSYGDLTSCGQNVRPAVHTKVSTYLYWIVDNLKP